MSSNLRNFFIWSAIFIALIAGVDSLTRRVNAPVVSQFTYSRFIEAVNANDVQEVTLQGHQITGKTRRGEMFATYAPYDASLIPLLLDRGVNLSALPVETKISFWQILLPLLPLLLICGLVFFSFKQMQSNGNRALGFGRSNAKLAEEKKMKVTFDDVAGADEAKQDLQEVVDFLKDPQKFQRLGGKIPKGFLLVGPPGTGKTLLAKAVAGEAGVPFFSIAGSDFVEMFVGVGASRVRDLFGQAKKNSPCIIFIDEIDAVGRRRSGNYGGNDERDQTLNQLLVEMDGFDDAQTIIVIAATNRLDVLDQALLRPGRFDRRIVVPIPDLQGREKILAVHLKKVPLAPNVKIDILARRTPGFSGADLANLVNESALLAARLGKLAVGMQELEEARDKVIMGAERRSLVMTEEAKKITAHHEAGHAVVAFYTPGTDPIHKATIVPRGSALGLVATLPKDDRVDYTYEWLTADIMVSMGGRIAEELIFGPEKIGAGASSDIKAATNLARRMVTEWGMSRAVGFLNCDFGDSSFEAREFSEATAKIIDDEVNRILTTCYQKATDVITEHRQQLVAIASALLDRETLSGDEIKLLCEGKELPPQVDTSSEVAVPESIPNTSSKRKRGRPKKQPPQSEQLT